MMSLDYDKALKMGHKCYQKYLMEGRYPYIQVLDEILSHADVVSEEYLGLVQIPAELIAGTVTAGRRTAFAPNFMPLLGNYSEFAGKWSALCEAHLQEGIRDPIKAYEFMNRYYVVEGNKRVSVLKYYDAATIPGTVTRMVPRRTDAYENRLYFEYLDFYRKSGMVDILFTRLGSYDELEKLLGRTQTGEFSADERMELHSAFVRFSKAYREIAGTEPKVAVSDALLVYLQMFSYPELCETMPAKLRTDIVKIWEDIQLLSKDNPTEIVTEPAEPPKKNLLEKILSPSPSRKLKIAFIHAKNKENSGWTYGHELGRLYLEQQFQDQVETFSISDVTLGASLEEAFQKAFDQKCDVIFTTTPRFLETSLKEAVRHPEVKILNCSVNPEHRYVRTYYARLFEAKFLSGIIAASLSRNDHLGYIADYPISGMIANINAFAIGAKMVNPRVKVHLEWTSVAPREEISRKFRSLGIHMVSGQEMLAASEKSRMYGLFNTENDKLENIAMAIWHWGEVYRRLVQNILDGTWKAEDNDRLAMSYWWGMSAGAIDIICSENVPQETRQMVTLFRRAIQTGDFHLFSGPIRTQDGMIEQEEGEHLSPEDIIGMDWLAENVVGSLPGWESLNQEAKEVVTVQGLTPVDEKTEAAEAAGQEPAEKDTVARKEGIIKKETAVKKEVVIKKDAIGQQEAARK